MHISSSYAKILGETNFHTREFPQSGSKAKDGEKKREKEERKWVITMVAHAKPPGPISSESISSEVYIMSSSLKYYHAGNNYN